MKQIPTAEEYLNENISLQINLDERMIHEISKQVIEFTKLHVKAALKAASENAEAIEGWNTGFSGSAASVDKDSILNAYPLTNIK